MALISVATFSVQVAWAADAGIDLSTLGASQTKLPFKWDVPNVVSTVDMPGATWSMGVPVKMQAVTVKGNMDDTIRHVYDSFVRQGLFIDKRQTKGPMLTGVDPNVLITYTALFQQNAPGYITVVLGEANIRAAKKHTGSEIVPLFPGAEGVLRSSFEGIQSVVYTVSGTTQEKVREFYSDALLKVGYQRDPQEPSTFRKPGDEVMVRVSRQEAKVGVYATRRYARAEGISTP